MIDAAIHDALAVLADASTRTVGAGALVNLALWTVAAYLVARRERRGPARANLLLIIAAFVLVDLIVVIAYGIRDVDPDLIQVLIGFAVGVQTVAALVTVLLAGRRRMS